MNTPFTEEVISAYTKDDTVYVQIEEHNQGKSINLQEALSKQRVDFISMHVNGRELQTLSGLHRVLVDNPQVKLLITFNPRLQKATGHNPEELLASLYSLGFEVYLLDEAKRKYYRLKDNFHSLVDLMGENLQSNLLCMNARSSLLITHFSHMANMTGAEKSLVAQMQDLKEKDVLSHVVVPHKGALTDYMRANAVSYDVVPFHWWGNIRLPTLAHMADSLKAISHYVDELKKINPHLIYTNTLTIPWGAIAAYLIHKPHVWHIKEFGIKDHGFKFIFDFGEIKKVIAQLSDLILFNSKAVAKDFGKTYGTKAKTLYYNIRIDEKDAKEKVPSPFKHDDTLKLILVGGVFLSKGQHEAIDAIKDLNKRHIPVELAILGQYNEKSHYYKELLSMLSESKLMNVYFIQKVPNPYPYVKQAHILLVCSRMEAFGKVTVEGMLLKKLVIAANAGGSPELIADGKTGYLYEYGNAKSLADRIEKIYRNKQLITTIGKRAQAYALKAFSNNGYVEEIWKLLFNASTRKPSSQNGLSSYIGELLKYFTAESNGTKNNHPVQPPAMTKLLSRLRGYN